MELHLDGAVYSVGQLGSGFLILSPPLDLPPGVGEVMLRIDGAERRIPVRLEIGSSSVRARTPVCTPAPSSQVASTSAA